MQWYIRFVIRALLIVLVLTFSRAAEAHQIGLSRGDYVVRGNTIDCELVFARADANDALVKDLHASADGAACQTHFVGSEPFEDAVRLRAQIACASGGDIVIRADFLDHLPAGHSHLATMSGDRSAEGVLDRTHRELRATSDFALVRLGIEHIFFGWDHLAFLLGLVIVGGRLREIVIAVTAFTIAHSITLGLAAFDVIHAAGWLVEPAIALSVAYVGIENIFLRPTEGRWRVTLPFGLIHGFGFATALRELAVPRAKIPISLFAFNVGVEIGQLAVLVVALPIVWLLLRWEFFRKWGVRAVSAAITVLGLVWFVQRIAR